MTFVGVGRMQWSGAVLAPVARLFHRHINGVFTGAEYGVSVVMEVRDPKRPQHEGRWVVHEMTPAMARRRAEELITAADDADRKNKEI